MKRVLVVAYYYPPIGGAGVLRTLKFTQYLPEFGFLPTVLTVGNRSIGARDPTLVQEIPDEVKVIATYSAEHRSLRAPRLLGVDPRWFLIPDVHIGWVPFAVHHGLAAIRRENTDIIMATAPVFSSLLAGHILAERTGKPLVLDFRDPWTQNVFHPSPTWLHRRIEERMERMVLLSADYVVTATEEMRQALIQKYPFVRQKSETIANGFDSSDFHGLSRSVSPDRFTIAHVGNLYGLRTSEQFLTALRGLIRKNQALRSRIRVVFAGPTDRRTLKLVTKLQLAGIIEMIGFVAHRESLQLMMNADVLLLLMSQREVVDNGTGPLMMPGKTFEYLGARRPILALVPEGAVSDLIMRTGSGIVAAPDQPAEIEDAIMHLFSRWQQGALQVPPYDLSAFERRPLTARLAAIFEALCSG